jgi:hypothetical protein
MSVLRNDGGGRFSETSIIATDLGASYACAGDWKRDGKQGIAVSNNAVGSISILVDRDTGNYSQSQTIQVTNGTGTTCGISAGDWDRDGQVDLAVADGDANTVSILKNSDGVFTEISRIPLQQYSTIGLVAGDWNKDGALDLAVTNDASNTVSILLNRGTVTGIGGKSLGVPGKSSLAQNYPNPFNPVTTINYGVASTSEVRLSVYNILGEEVSTLVDGILGPGSYTVQWNASHLPSGLYFYKITAGEFKSAKKLILAK